MSGQFRSWQSPTDLEAEALMMQKTPKFKPRDPTIKTAKYTPLNAPTFVPLSPPSAIPWNPRSLNSSVDEEALVRDQFPSRYDRKVYDNGHRRISGREKAKFGWKVIVIIVVIVLAVVGVGAGVTIKITRA